VGPAIPALSYGACDATGCGGCEAGASAWSWAAQAQALGARAQGCTACAGSDWGPAWAIGNWGCWGRWHGQGHPDSSRRRMMLIKVHRAALELVEGEAQGLGSWQLPRVGGPVPRTASASRSVLTLVQPVGNGTPSGGVQRRSRKLAVQMWRLRC
jgi:hypothetical protein